MQTKVFKNGLQKYSLPQVSHSIDSALPCGEQFIGSTDAIFRALFDAGSSFISDSETLRARFRLIILADGTQDNLSNCCLRFLFYVLVTKITLYVNQYIPIYQKCMGTCNFRLSQYTLFYKKPVCTVRNFLRNTVRNQPIIDQNLNDRRCFIWTLEVILSFQSTGNRKLFLFIFSRN